jgi:hypothetical protein
LWPPSLIDFSALFLPGDLSHPFFPAIIIFFSVAFVLESLSEICSQGKPDRL